MRIAIIGAGAAGLAALRHSLNENHDCEVFEQTGLVGGTWNYTDKTGNDEFGLTIHSSMYQGLRTNLPKELMQFEDFPYVTPEHSYIMQPEVLQYINDFTKHFKLLPHIKFFKSVTKVSPLERGRWSIEVRDLKLNSVEIKEFDAVFVCVGNNSVPWVPTFRGIENFQGTTMHSHSFRKAESFSNRRVLIIGAGPSGIDIARLINDVSKNVILCHRSPLNPLKKLPKTINTKPEVKEFKTHSVIFKDSSEESIDDIIFCTGYLYSYPFLTKDCDITVENKWVKYLYKQIVNINHPTMGFINIPSKILPFVIFGIQARFFLAHLKAQVITKTKEEMMNELLNYMNRRKEEGIPFEKAHFVGFAQGEYMDDLATIANIKKVPSPVLMKLYRYVYGEGEGKINLSFRIINDYEYKVIENS